MSKTKNKKKNLAEATSNKKRKEQSKKTLNPFEVHINREKQKVIGKKGKNDRGLPGVSRAKAINKRKGTLLQEFRHKDKDNTFLDKRIGEKNRGMTMEERAIARFAAEKVRSHKKKSECLQRFLLKIFLPLTINVILFIFFSRHLQSQRRGGADPPWTDPGGS